MYCFMGSWSWFRWFMIMLVFIQLNFYDCFNWSNFKKFVLSPTLLIQFNEVVEGQWKAWLLTLCSSLNEVDNEAFDQQSHSMIRLNNNTILLLKEVSKVLAIVCIIREEHFQQQGLIEYNFKCFKEAISQVFAVRAKNMLENATS